MDLGRTFWTGIKWAAAGLAAWWLGMPAAFKLLIVLQIADVVAGCLVAQKRSEVRSAILGRGIRIKALAWVIVLVVYALEIYAIDAVFGDMMVVGLHPAEFAAIGFAIAEALSIVENAQKLGLPIPSFLANALAQTHGEVFDEEP